MSQITRCPSCATKFKVVADQLRISDGWVRCGHCKEVFDASAHLLPSERQDLLPDVSMTAARPPSMPVTHAANAGQVWRAHSVVMRSAVSVPGAPPVSEHGLSGDQDVPGAKLDAPVPVVPAFLVTAAATVFSPETRSTLPPGSVFSWQSFGTADGIDVKPTAGARVQVMAADEGGAPKDETPGTPMDEIPAGYELPSAELSDLDGPDEVPSEDPLPAVQTHHAPRALLRKQSDEASSLSGFGSEGADVQAREDGPVQGASTSFAEPLSPETLSRSGMGQSEELESASFESVPLEQEESDSPEESLNAEDVSFVRAAKRKAFWRRPFVRLGLGAIVVVLLCMLALQAVLQERDRIAAMDPGVRPWLQMLCEPFQCTLAPLRHISDVVIDSSSFNKGRGDSYQLTFTIKNRVNVPLAMPAMELTLTDAQDQPVLRRVFLPQELLAPLELSASGTWTSSVAVIVTTGGAHVAGYRLLAFYP